MEPNNQSQIYSDFMIIKSEIWESNFNFLNDLSSLMIYEKIGKSSRQVYLQTYRNAYLLLVKIGLNRFKKYLPTAEFKELKEFDSRYLEDNNLSLQDFVKFRDLVALFLHLSGMDKIDVEMKDSGNAWSENR